MSGKNLKIIVVILAIVLLAVIGALAWYIVQPGQSGSENSGSQTALSVKDASSNAKQDAQQDAKGSEKNAPSSSGGASSNFSGNGSSSSTNIVDSDVGIGDSTDDGGTDENEGPRIVDGGSGGIGDEDEGSDRG